MNGAARIPLLDALRSGAVFSRARALRLAAAYLALMAASLALMIATSDGFLDRGGRPIGTDFIAFHAAGEIAREHGPAAAYDPSLQMQEYQQRFGREDPPYWPYLYPPAFIVIAMALAAAPYLLSWALWCAATLALYATAMLRIVNGRATLLCALALPAVYSNVLHGQTGALVAALFAFGLIMLRSGRPLLAGFILGLIALKPQYGLLTPIALLAGAHYRAVAGAAASVALQIAAPTLLFGPEIWIRFFATMAETRELVVESGSIGFEKIQTIFAQARLIGAPSEIAYAFQGMLAIALAFGLFRLWRSDASFNIKAAALIAGSVLATPYVVDYDLIILAPAAAFMIRDAMATGFRDFEKCILFSAAFAPAIARTAGEAAHVSPGFLGAAALAAAIFARGFDAIRLRAEISQPQPMV
jgi:hypothetical protein